MYELGGFVPRKRMSSEMSEVFSRRMRLSGIGAAVARRIEANAAECAALAALFNLPAIGSLTGDFRLRHEQRGIIAATLRLRAAVTQTCVITLEPFDAVVTEDAALRLVPAASIHEAAELVVDADTLEGPDEIPYAGETIDLGAILAEPKKTRRHPAAGFRRRRGQSFRCAETPEWPGPAPDLITEH